MASSLPLVTVVTPTYNRAAELTDTIESVLAQTYPNVEYILVDDGSTDSTPDVLRRYEGRVQWVRQSNMGEASATNRGWEMARGEFVATVSSDDPVFPDWLARAVPFLESRKDVLVGYPDWVMIDERGRELKYVQVQEYDQAKMVLWNCCMPGPGAVMRGESWTLLTEIPTFITRATTTSTSVSVATGLLREFLTCWRVGETIGAQSRIWRVGQSSRPSRSKLPGLFSISRS